MKSNVITITIGIPAYNEEDNLPQLCDALEQMKSTNFFIEKVIIAIDGATDNTYGNIKDINTSRTEIINGTSRKGKWYRLNQIIKLATTDLLILIDADCFVDKNTFEAIVAVYKKTKSDLISGYPTPMYSNNFVSQIVVQGVWIRREIMKRMNKGQNVYAFHGSLMALSKPFYKGVVVPNRFGTDAYLYFFAKTNGYRLFHARDAKVMYMVPATVKDHTRQATRFSNSIEDMANIFGDRIRKEYKIPIQVKIEAIFIVFKSHPIYLVIYLTLHCFTKLFSLSRARIRTGIWEISRTTKGKIYFKLPEAL